MENGLRMQQSVKALVVDDSAVARKVLSSILHREGLESDVASSAAEAFKYLLTSIPDVIFLDHAMPGMDGFDALKLIKSDARTANIPVIMFTSRSGETYLQEARALGAVDVLSKDSLAEIDLTQWLQKLNILRAEVRQPELVEVGSAEAPSMDSENLSARVIRGLVREELARIGVNSTSLSQHMHQESAGVSQRRIPDDFNPHQVQSPDQPRSSWRLAWVPLALVGSLLILWTLVKQPQQVVEMLPENPVAVAAMSKVKSTSGEIIEKRAQYTDRSLRIIDWAINQKMTYALGELPLAEKRLEDLRDVLFMLKEADFKGTVQLVVHQGRFCVGTDSTGKARLPADEDLLDSCEIQVPQPGVSVSQLMSLPFSMFMDNSTRGIGEQGIRLSASSAIAETPRVQYPEPKPEMSAAAWNQIAARNHRVEVRFLKANSR